MCVHIRVMIVIDSVTFCIRTNILLSLSPFSRSLFFLYLSLPHTHNSSLSISLSLSPSLSFSISLYLSIRFQEGSLVRLCLCRSPPALSQDKLCAHAGNERNGNRYVRTNIRQTDRQTDRLTDRLTDPRLVDCCVMGGERRNSVCD